MAISYSRRARGFGAGSLSQPQSLSSGSPARPDPAVRASTPPTAEWSCAGGSSNRRAWPDSRRLNVCVWSLRCRTVWWPASSSSSPQSTGPSDRTASLLATGWPRRYNRHSCHLRHRAGPPGQLEDHNGADLKPRSRGAQPSPAEVRSATKTPRHPSGPRPHQSFRPFWVGVRVSRHSPRWCANLWHRSAAPASGSAPHPRHRRLARQTS